MRDVASENERAKTKAASFYIFHITYCPQNGIRVNISIILEFLESMETPDTIELFKSASQIVENRTKNLAKRSNSFFLQTKTKYSLTCIALGLFSIVYTFCYFLLY